VEGVSASAASTAHTLSLSESITRSGSTAPLRGKDEAARALTPPEVRAVEAVLASVEQLENSFARHSVAKPYQPLPVSELRLRPPL
jgi:hypothetical protein